MALAAKQFGKRPSELIQVADELTALDFDLACSFRLLKFENEQAVNNAKLIAYEVGKILAGGE